jgi:hypothetical protein
MQGGALSPVAENGTEAHPANAPVGLRVGVGVLLLAAGRIWLAVQPYVKAQADREVAEHKARWSGSKSCPDTGRAGGGAHNARWRRTCR